MFDLWFATGVGIMRPALLDTVQSAQPAFDFVKREITETDAAGNVTKIPPSPASGLLEDAATTRVRDAISGFIRAFSSAAPPVSIYAAGRFSQYFLLPAFSPNPGPSTFRTIMALANNAYTTALAGDPESTLPGFPAFLGACLMDGILASGLDKPTGDQQSAAKEFGLNPDPSTSDWRIAVRFTQKADFVTASSMLMSGGLDPWENGTGEQIFFWPGRSEHAIP